MRHTRVVIIEMLAGSPLLLLFTVAALGYLAGKIEIRGFGLGVAAVLFVGLAIGGMDPSLRLPEFVLQFGLVTFVYVVGLGSAPGFFAGLRRRGIQALALTLMAVGLGTIVLAVLGNALGFSAPTIAGTFAGATTNTPALAAVVDILGKTDGQAGAVVGYSLAYPFGVFGALATVAMAPRLLGTDPAAGKSGHDETQGMGEEILTATAIVDCDLPEMSVAYLRKRLKLRVAFGRMLRGDLVTVVGDPTAVREAIAALGRESEERVDLDRTVVDFRRMVLSNARLAARPLRDLELGERFGAVVTRIRRGDVDLVADADTNLELGDAVRVVAPRERLGEVAAYLGDSLRALAEIDVISFSLGIGLGLVLGQVPIPLPGGGTFSFGFAGGPLIVGLVLGRVGRSGPLVWTLPPAAATTLRQIGLVMFLAAVGTGSGWAFAAAVRQGGVLPVLLLGMLVTLVVTGATLVIGRRLLHLPSGMLLGMLAGIQTQPAVLAFAVERTRNQQPDAGYAAVYPVATIAKILIAQLLLLQR
jgi:putative transport protein